MKPHNEKPKVKRYLNIWSVAIFVIYLALVTYFVMPSYNRHSYTLWITLAIGFGIMFLVDGLMYGAALDHDKNAPQPVTFAMTIVFVPAIIVFMLLGTFIGSAIFQSGNYASVIGNVKSKSMDSYEISIDDVPLLDADTAYLLANRKMGTLVDLVSQFELDDTNVQINYQGQPVRVIPLRYNGVIKWLNNRDEGIPGYVIVNMQTQTAELVYVDGGIHYSPSGCFGDDLLRHVRLSHLNEILNEYTFELMDDGTPVWIVRSWEKTVGWFNAPDLKGIYVVNAVTGDTEYYSASEIPQWVDTAYSASHVIDQYDWYGKYQDGWLNSWIAKRGVVATTDGYNYIAYNDDIYLYTGVTSVSSDESNIGFIYTNLRTKETVQYMYPSAEEYSAMSSAEGLVQHLGYYSTFPIMVRVVGVPTYCMALKDNAGLVKLYAMVNAEQYQVVTAETTVDQTITSYVDALDLAKIEHDDVSVVEYEPDDTISEDPIEYDYFEGTVTYVNHAVIDGYTYYYLMLDTTDNVMFEVKAKDENKPVIFVELGEYVHIFCESGLITNTLIIPAYYENDRWIMDEDYQLQWYTVD